MSGNESLNDLAVRYLTGNGADKDIGKALELLSQAAEQGDGTAAYNLGYIYRIGSEVPQNPECAIKWLRKAVEDKENVNIRAYYDLAICLLDDGFLGYAPTPEMQKEAFSVFKEAAGCLLLSPDKEQSDIQAELKMRLGVCYFHGTGTEIDLDEGVRWMRDAANKGNAVAQNNMGVICKEGQGVLVDNKAAISWFRKAAEQGYAEAQFNLGCCLLDTSIVGGPLTDEMVKEAFDCACAAIDNEYIDANYLMEIFYRTGTFVKKDLKKAYECLKIAADNGHEVSQEGLTHYKKGIFGYTYIP